MVQPIVSVILSGGAGTRLWPVSREAAPNPSMDGPGRSLLRKTFERAGQPGTLAHTLVVTNCAFADETRKELGRPAQADYSLLLEPAGRNTAHPQSAWRRCGCVNASVPTR